VIVTDASCNEPNSCFQRSGIWRASYELGATVNARLRRDRTNTMRYRLSKQARPHYLLAGLAFGHGGVLRRVDRYREVVRTPELEPDLAVRALRTRYAEHEVELALFERCARRLADVLRGDVDPLQLLFPDGSLEHAEQLYRDSRLARGPNALARQAVEQVVAALPPDGVLRVLEIGAGTGGTTAHVLSALPPQRTEYVFTDV
jgi:hypothetical protein